MHAMKKNEKNASLLKDWEVFEQNVADRKVIVTFKLDGKIGKGLSEVGVAIKDPADDDDDKYGVGLSVERITNKKDKDHYMILNDADILDLAAKGLAYQSVERILSRQMKNELIDTSDVRNELADFMAFMDNTPILSNKSFAENIRSNIEDYNSFMDSVTEYIETHGCVK